MSPTTDIEQRLREDVARAWASIDGKVEQFDLEKNNPNLAYDDPSYVGSYEGYLTEADELLKRSGVGALVASLRSKLEEAAGALEPFALVAEYDIGDSESDEDIFRPMDGRNSIAGLVRVGHLRAARRALASLREADHG